MGPPVVALRAVKGAIKIPVPTIGLIMPNKRGCRLWSPDLRTSVQVTQTLQSVLQAIENARTITAP